MIMDYTTKVSVNPLGCPLQSRNRKVSYQEGLCDHYDLLQTITSIRMLNKRIHSQPEDRDMWLSPSSGEGSGFGEWGIGAHCGDGYGDGWWFFYGDETLEGNGLGDYRPWHELNQVYHYRIEYP